MNELGQLSLADLREVASRLAVPNARRMPRSELLVRLAPHAGEVVQLISPPPAGRIVMSSPGPAGMKSSEPASGEREPRKLPTESGAGRRSVPQPEAPRVYIADLPWAYEDDRVVLLVRDPKTLYTYWDFHPDTVQAAVAGLREAKALLRVWQLGGSEPHVTSEFEIDLGGRAYYVYDCEPNRDYRIELLFRGADGAERRIGRQSNVATLPPNHPSAWVEDRFVSIPLEVPLSAASVFITGKRPASEGEKRMHARAYELSGGEAVFDEAEHPSSSTRYAKGFGGRFWSGTLVRK